MTKSFFDKFNPFTSIIWIGILGVIATIFLDGSVEDKKENIKAIVEMIGLWSIAGIAVIYTRVKKILERLDSIEKKIEKSERQ